MVVSWVALAETVQLNQCELLDHTNQTINVKSPYQSHRIFQRSRETNLETLKRKVSDFDDIFE